MLGVLLFWVGCPLSRLAATASRLPRRVLSASGRRPAPTDAAAETGRWATSHRDVAAPEGEPSMCAAKSLQKAKSRLPLWGRCPPREGGEGKVPAAPSHGLCGSAGGLPSQSPNGDSSPEGGAKSRLPLLGAQKSFARPQTQKKTLGGTGCLVSIERAAVLDPHVPRADALLGVGQGQPVQGF